MQQGLKTKAAVAQLDRTQTIAVVLAGAKRTTHPSELSGIKCNLNTTHDETFGRFVVFLF